LRQTQWKPLQEGSAVADLVVATLVAVGSEVIALAAAASVADFTIKVADLAVASTIRGGVVADLEVFITLEMIFIREVQRVGPRQALGGMAISKLLEDQGQHLNQVQDPDPSRAPALTRIMVLAHNPVHNLGLPVRMVDQDGGRRDLLRLGLVGEVGALAMLPEPSPER